MEGMFVSVADQPYQVTVHYAQVPTAAEEVFGKSPCLTAEWRKVVIGYEADSDNAAVLLTKDFIRRLIETPGVYVRRYMLTGHAAHRVADRILDQRTAQPGMFGEVSVLTFDDLYLAGTDLPVVI